MNSHEPGGNQMSTGEMEWPLVSYSDGWRGIAHYRTDAGRRVVKKSPEDRTDRDLYVLEEAVTACKLISDLPLSKRLEVCRYLGYMNVHKDHVCAVFRQGDLGSTFYIIFTGTVKVSVEKEGVQEPFVSHLIASDSFGEHSLNDEIYKMDATVTATERCEFMTLSKNDYDFILKIPKSLELKERVKFLQLWMDFSEQTIAAFNSVSKQSLRRLANVLTVRTFPKNRVLAFQGDDAVEMYFIRAGECRVIMEVAKAAKPVLRLPRVSTFLNQYAPTTHRQCKLEVQEKEKHWWRPSLIARSSKRFSSTIHSATTLDMPRDLAGMLLQSPDMIHTLFNRRAIPQQQSDTRFSPRSSMLWSPQTEPSGDSAPTYLQLPSSVKWSRGDSSTSPLLQHMRTQPADLHSRASDPPDIPRGNYFSNSQKEVSKSVPFGKDVPKLELRKAPDPRPLLKGPPRQSSVKKKYTLASFVKECERKEKCSSEIEDFREKDHGFWDTRMSDGLLKSGFGKEVHLYRKKFKHWARSVIEREKKLLGFSMYKGFQNVDVVPSFMQGCATSKVQKLEHPQQKRKKDERTMILDIGAVYAGEYFGERGLLSKSQRAASIVAVTAVDTLVLNKWDLYRNCNRDIIEILSMHHDYKKEEHIYKQYLRTCRWERYKKKVLGNVLEAKRFRIYMRIGPRAVRFIPKHEPGKKVQKKEWLR